MAYAAKADLLNRIPEGVLAKLTDDDNFETVDDDVVDAILEDSTSEVNSYVSVVQTVPISPTPDLLKNLTLDIAEAKIYQRRYSDDEIPSKLKKYQNAINTLLKIAEGKITIGRQTDSPGMEISVDKTDLPEFHDDNLNGY